MKDWTRFLHHAPRVRKLRFVWLPHTIANLKIIHECRPHGVDVLLPGLQSLDYEIAVRAAEDPLLPVNLLAHPGVRSLKIHFNMRATCPPSLAFLEQLVPEVRSLDVLPAQDHPVTIVFPEIKSLTEVRCRNMLLTSPFLRHVGHLPNLKTLEAYIDVKSLEPRIEQTGMFPALRCLLLRSSGLTEVLWLLDHITSRRLETFHVELRREPATPDVQQCVKALSRQPRLSRLDIRVRASDRRESDPQIVDEVLISTAGCIVAGDDLSPFFALPLMSTFVLHNLPLSLEARHVEAMAVAWPNLQDLVLGAGPGSGLTLESLKPLSLHCPKLRSLAVSTAPTPPTSLLSGGMISFNRLRSVLGLRSPSDADIARVPLETTVQGLQSVCPLLYSIDIAVSSSDNPRSVASFISQYFPNVREVSTAGYAASDAKALKKTRELLQKQGAQRWQLLDKVASEQDGKCHCDQCKPMNALSFVLLCRF